MAALLFPGVAEVISGGLVGRFLYRIPGSGSLIG